MNDFWTILLGLVTSPYLGMVEVVWLVGIVLDEVGWMAMVAIAVRAGAPVPNDSMLIQTLALRRLY